MFRKKRPFLAIGSDKKQVLVPIDEILSITSTKKITKIKLYREEEVEVSGDYVDEIWKRFRKGKMINAKL